MVQRRLRLSAAFLLPLTLPAFVGGAPAADRSPRGAAALLDLEALPLLRDGVAAHHISSFDRKGGNDDGFDGTWSALSERKGEHVILEARGPGCLYTLWFTGPDGGYSALPWGRLRIYFGAEEAPRVEVEANDFFAGRDPRFPRPLVAGPTVSSGGYVSYVPIEFRDGLRITTERRAGFYNAYWQSYRDAEGLTDGPPHGESVERLRELFSHRGSWRDLCLARAVRGDGPPPPEPKRIESRHPLPAGKTVMIAEIAGAGRITEVRVDPLFPPTEEDLRELRIRIAFDDEKEPAVDVPLGMFFGSGLGEAHVTSLLAGMSTSGWWYNALPMPFWSRARVELANPTARSFGEVLGEVLWTDRPYPKGAAGRLHAVYRNERPTTRGKDYTILDATGRGHLAGYVLAIHPLAPENKRWWEGDARLFVDGLRTPAIHGTGHEDDHLGGWSNEFLSRPFSLPFHGEPAVGPLTDVGGQLNGACSLYRFYVPVPFETGIRHGCEHGIGNRDNYGYSSCAFYYLAGTTRMDRADELRLGDAASAAGHRLESGATAEPIELESTFEGDESRPPERVAGRRFPGKTFAFTAHIPAGNAGLRLRALFDAAEGNRAMDVFIDGAAAASWFRAGANPHRRFREEDIEIDPRLTRGKSEVRIEVRADGPLAEFAWTVFGYRGE